MALEDAAAWHGWAHDNRALFITPLDDERIGLFVQQGRDTQCAAVFVDPAMAMIIMDFLDSSLTATAQANTDLLDRLRNEQPLAFPQHLVTQQEEDDPEREDVPDDAEELFGELGRG